MLVLTRRSKDKISFPQLGVTVHFIRVQSGQVKVGVDAPREITILRDEIAQDSDAANLLQRQMSHLPKDVRHGIRNELHQISVGLHLHKELMAASIGEEANEVFEQIQESLGRLDKAEVLNPPSKTTKPSVADFAAEGKSVVLVEDQSNEREMLASVLRLKDISVVTLANGNEAIDYFHDNPPPSYLLIDMQMPVCDGPTAISQLRSEQQLDSTQVFALSGMSPESYGVSIGDAHSGVDRWFPKPLDPSFLLDAIK
jgi:carbon storage regulator CsrA